MKRYLYPSYSQLSTFRLFWISLGKNHKYLAALFFLIVSAIISSFIYSKFMVFNETRPGYVIYDPIIANIGPYDLSRSIFNITYFLGSIALALSMLTPSTMARTLLAVMLMTYMRMLTLTLFPLEAPMDIILLRDPLIEGSFYQGDVLTKDLFFSGHTANLFLMMLLLPYRGLKPLMTLATIAVATMLVLQHVHFTIDVIAAPFFAYLAFRLTTNFIKRYLPEFYLDNQ